MAYFLNFIWGLGSSFCGGARMAHPFSDEAVAAELLAYCTVAWADDLDRCPFADLARTSRAFAAAARAVRAAHDGCVDHSCKNCVTWRGAVDLSLVRKYLALTRGAAVVGGGLSLSGAALRRAVQSRGPDESDE